MNLEEKFSCFNTVATLPGGADTLEGGLGNDTYELDPETAAGSQIKDTVGIDTLILDDANISLSKPETNVIGIAKDGTTLIIDLNQDGAIDPENDLTILDYFDESGTGAGNGFIENVGNLDGINILAKLTSTTNTNTVIEAELLNLNTYLVEDFAAINTNDETDLANATGISLLNSLGTEGTASLLASDYNLSGIYDLSISYFDENDGEARLQVLKNDTILDEILVNENTGSGYPTEETRREYVIENLDIASSDTITIKGIAGIGDRGSEWARVDFLSFALDTEIAGAATSEI